LQSIGFGYDEVAKLTPKIIYASITGYGHTGPWADRPGYDLAVQGQSGIMSRTGDPTGPPYKTGTARADVTAGLDPTLGIVLALLEKAGIPCGPIYTVGEVLNHPQVLAREMVVERPHPKLGKVKMTGVPIKLSETPGEAGAAPPVLGQHTEEILRELA